MDVSAYFRDKRVTVMGLGLLGRGIGDTRFLAECGADIVVTDLKSREELASSIEALAAFPRITFVLGEHRLEDFRDRDFILKAAGVPLDSPYIAEAKKNGIPVRMSADLFMEFARIPIVGVTGTRGKSTVTHMIYAILKAAREKVLLGGNVRGISTLALLSEVTQDAMAVLELDSWQCQGLGEAKLSPQVAVFTTFFSDHLNYYAEKPEQYLSDKANIFLSQNEKDTLIVGKQCAPIVIDRYGEAIAAKTLVVDELKLPDTWTLSIPGVHNRYNAALALAAARTLGIRDEVSRSALESFRGVSGRLELIREVNGIKVYNDTTATTPEATLAALAALRGAERNIILLMGGADKNLDMNSLLYELPNFVKRTLLLAGTGTNRVLEFIPNASVFDDLSKAVEEAFLVAVPGDIILFSPAFASFGMFRNEYDRGDQFVTVVQAYEK